MKKSAFILAVTVLFVSCNGDSDDKKTKLSKLKAQRDKLSEEIALLENELSNSDTTMLKNIKIKEVAFETVVIKTFEHYIDVQGKIDGDEVVDINVKMPGTVQAVMADEGKVVSKGEVLATIESDAIQKNLDALKAQYDLIKILYEKQKNLWEQKIGTEVQFLQAKAQKESMEKQIAALNEQLDMTRIKSPINGTLEMINAKVGSYAMPGMPVARVVNTSKLKVSAEVSESYANKVKTGDAVIIEFPNLNKSIKEKVSFAAKYINPASRSFTVESKLASDDEYRANMIAILKVRDYINEKALVVPVNLIQKDEEGDYVLVAYSEKGIKKAKKIKVSRVNDYKGMVEVSGELKEGDNLITKGYQDLNDGEEIKY